METEIWESDAFTAGETNPFPQTPFVPCTTTAYRFQKGHEIYIHEGDGRPLKVRLIDMRVHARDGGKLTREILALKV